MKNTIYLFIVLFFATNFGFSQSSNLGNWLIYIGSKKLNSQWNWHHEVQYRNYNAIGDLEQLLLRTGIGYNLSEGNNNLLLGYGYINSQNYAAQSADKSKVGEHRIFQQFITRQNKSRLKVQHRFRLEERWVENSDFKLRFRYFLGLNVPLNNAELVDKTVYLSSYNELFLNHKKTVFDRNRIYGGLGYKLNSRVKFEIGYLNQFFNAGSRDQINLITFLNF